MAFNEKHRTVPEGALGGSVLWASAEDTEEDTDGPGGAGGGAGGSVLLSS